MHAYAYYLHCAILVKCEPSGYHRPAMNRSKRSTRRPPALVLFPSCVCGTLKMVSRAATQLYDEILRPCGLRATQLSILATISRLRQSSLVQLTQVLIMDQTTLTRGLKVLERDGLLERVPHPDRRVKLLRVSPRGTKVLQAGLRLWKVGQHAVVEDLGGMTSWRKTQQQLSRLLTVLRTGPAASLRNSQAAQDNSRRQ